MMEGVGARLGRSSSRYGPATVFTGPVRKWKKKWIHVADNKHHHSNSNPSSNGNNNDASRILLYKWTPIRKTHKTDDDDVEGEPPRRKMKYIPIALLEEQEQNGITIENDTPSKPDMNDVPMEENQVSENIQEEKQDLSKSTVGLGLNLNASDDGDVEET